MVAGKFIRLTRDDAARFYIVHRDKGFYGSLTEFMSSGPVFVSVLEGEDAIAKARTIMVSRIPPKRRRTPFGVTSPRTWNRTLCTGPTPRIPHVGRLHFSSVNSNGSASETGGRVRGADPAGSCGVVSEQGLPAYRARQVLRWLYQRGAQSWGEMTDLRWSCAAPPGCVRVHGATARRRLTIGRRDRKLLFCLEATVRSRRC